MCGLLAALPAAAKADNLVAERFIPNPPVAQTADRFLPTPTVLAPTTIVDPVQLYQPNNRFLPVRNLVSTMQYVAPPAFVDRNVPSVNPTEILPATQIVQPVERNLDQPQYVQPVEHFYP